MSYDTTATDRFHAHLDDCRRCEEHPFDLCAIGAVLLKAAGDEAAAQLAGITAPPPGMGEGIGEE